MTAPNRVARLAVAAAVAWCPLTTLARAHDCPQQVGRSPYGPAYAVAVADDDACLGSGAALIVVDVSVPSSPLAVGRVSLPDIVQGVALSGGHDYVAIGSAGLRVVDVADPFASGFGVRYANVLDEVFGLSRRSP